MSDNLTCLNCEHCANYGDSLRCINVSKWSVALLGPRLVTLTDSCQRFKLRAAKVVNSR